MFSVFLGFSPTKPVGPNGALQFNNSGAFGGDIGMEYSVASGNNSIQFGPTGAGTDTNLVVHAKNAQLQLGTSGGNASSIQDNSGQGLFFDTGAGGYYEFAQGVATVRISNGVDVLVVGGGIRIAEGINGLQGVAVLVAGTVTINNTNIAANSRIFLTSQIDGGVPGFLRVSSRVIGTSFTVTSSNVADTSTFAYEIFTPG